MDIRRSPLIVSDPNHPWYKKAFHTAKSYYPKVLLTVLIVMLLLPLIHFDFSKAALAEFDKSYWSRKDLTTAFSSFRYHVLKDQVFDLTITAEGNWLVYTGEQSLGDYQNTIPFSKDELATIQERMDALEGYLNTRGIRLLVVIAPNKNTIYPEKMPLAIPVLGEQSRLDQLLTYMRENGRTEILDLRPALLTAKADHEVYYPTDTHWNPYGGFVGYREIVKKLAIDFPQIKPFTLDDFENTPYQVNEGDLSIMAQTRTKDYRFDLKPRFQKQFVIRDMTDAEGILYSYSMHTDKTLPRLVMYRDSFAAWIMPLLSNHFSHAVYIKSKNVSKELIVEEDPDVVIIELTERYIAFLTWMLPE